MLIISSDITIKCFNTSWKKKLKNEIKTPHTQTQKGQQLTMSKITSWATHARPQPVERVSIMARKLIFRQGKYPNWILTVCYAILNGVMKVEILAITRLTINFFPSRLSETIFTVNFIMTNG